MTTSPTKNTINSTMKNPEKVRRSVRFKLCEAGTDITLRPAFSKRCSEYPEVYFRYYLQRIFFRLQSHRVLHIWQRWCRQSHRAYQAFAALLSPESHLPSTIREQILC